MRQPANRLLTNAARRSPDSTPSVRRRRLRRSLASRTPPMSTISRQSSTHSTTCDPPFEPGWPGCGRTRYPKRRSRSSTPTSATATWSSTTTALRQCSTGNSPRSPTRCKTLRGCVFAPGASATTPNRSVVSDPSPHFAPGMSRRAVAGDDAIHWWSVARCAWWAIGLAGQAAAFTSGLTDAITLAASGRRVPELEYDLLRLITDGPAD